MLTETTASKNLVPPWSFQWDPIYTMEASWEENIKNGPRFQGAIPKRDPKPVSEWIKFLGFDIASPLGIPAGPLLDSRWTALACRLGFDVITYKTVRSRFHPSHPVPNVVYVEAAEQFSLQNPPSYVLRSQEKPKALEQLAISNSFGMPSQSPEMLQVDIELARKALLPGQILIVSIIGTQRPDRDFIEDFADTALLVKEAGAQAIEVDLSCPNVSSGEGSLYTSREAVGKIYRTVRQAVGGTPLVAKMGIFTEKETMKAILVDCARLGFQAVCGINTISTRLLDGNRQPALGLTRPTSGICGSPIRNAALQFIRWGREIVQEEGLDLAIMGCGGITQPEHFSLFLDNGADIALTATGMMWDPYLAIRYHQTHQERS